MSFIAIWGPLLLLLGSYPPLEEGLRLTDLERVPCVGPRFLADELPDGGGRAAGFHPPESSRSGRRFAWAGREAEIWLALPEDPQPRRLLLTAAGAVEGLGVRAWLNDVDLGERRLRKGFGEVRWPVPPGAVRPGLNVVLLMADQELRVGLNRRRLAVAIEELRVDPDASECPGGDRSATDLPADLPAGTALLARLPVPPDGRLQVEATGDEAAVLDLLLTSEGQQLPAGAVVVPASGTVRQGVTLPACCGVDRRLLVVARGPRAVRLQALELEGDVTASAWRRACAHLAPQVAAAVALGGLFLLAAWRGWRLPLARWAPWGDVALVLAVAVVARYLYLAAYPPGTGYSGDADEYLLRASSLATGHSSLLGDVYWHRWQSWLRPPGYYFFLAQLMRLGFETNAAIVGLQSWLWVTTPAATYALGHTLFGRGTALVAGLLYAVNLEALTYASVIGTEALFMPLLVPALALVAWLWRRPGFRLGVAAGVLLGLATLVRSAPVLFVPGAAALIVLGRGLRRSLRPVSALLLGMALVVVPWSVRNSLLLGHPMGVDNVALPNFLASHPDPLYLGGGTLDLTTEEGRGRYDWALKRYGDSLAGKPVMRRGLVRLASQPLRTLRMTGVGLARFLQPRTWLFAHRAGERDPCRVAAYVGIVNWQTFPILALALLGIVVRIRDRSTWPILFWFLVILATSAVLFPLPPAELSRYRASTIPVLLGYAGFALSYLHARLGQRLRGPS